MIIIIPDGSGLRIFGFSGFPFLPLLDLASCAEFSALGLASLAGGFIDVWLGLSSPTDLAGASATWSLFSVGSGLVELVGGTVSE
jgi:hypothetical protein